MKLGRFFIALVCWALALNANAQGADDFVRAKDAEWMSYRDAYKTMLWFEKYGKAKNLIQLQLQVVPKDKSLPIDNVRLHLVGKTTHVELPIDGTGRTALPLIKSAYDENAELALNQKIGQAQFYFRLSVNLRSDGIYDVADLRAACEQVFEFQTYLDSSATKGKKCVGVRLGFAKKEAVTVVEFKTASQTTKLAVSDNSMMWPEVGTNYRSSNLFFGQPGEKGQLVTRTMPLVIVALIE